MSDSSVSDTHSGGTARTVSQQTSPSHGTHSSSQSRQDNSAIIFTALFDYVAQGEDELSLQRGETVEVRVSLLCDLYILLLFCDYYYYYYYFLAIGFIQGRENLGRRGVVDWQDSRESGDLSGEFCRRGGMYRSGVVGDR